jgi:chorismate-pyruvate lyase
MSIRVDRELYDELTELREQSGKSLGDILRESSLTERKPFIKSFVRDVR